MKRDDIKTVLSLDGSEMHYYGESKEEDKGFDEIRSSSSFYANKINVPYAYLESGFKQSDRETDSIFNPISLSTAQKIYLHFSKATHEDFSCLPSLATQISAIKNSRSELHEEFNQFALNYFDLHLKDNSSVLSLQLSEIYKVHLADSIYPALNSAVKKNELTIHGKVVDKENNEPLAYVNVGVPDKNIGTVTQRGGSFSIKVNKELQTDSLEFSMVGYQSHAYSIADILKQNKSVTIFLKEKITELKEVMVSTKVLQSKKIGNTTTSKFISFGVPLKFLGSEIGIKLNLGRNPVDRKSV